jgi:hypothetical protein
VLHPTCNTLHWMHHHVVTDPRSHHYTQGSEYGEGEPRWPWPTSDPADRTCDPFGPGEGNGQRDRRGDCDRGALVGRSSMMAATGRIMSRAPFATDGGAECGSTRRRCPERQCGALHALIQSVHVVVGLEAESRHSWRPVTGLDPPNRIRAAGASARLDEMLDSVDEPVAPDSATDRSVHDATEALRCRHGESTVRGRSDNQ